MQRRTARWELRAVGAKRWGHTVGSRPAPNAVVVVLTLFITAVFCVLAAMQLSVSVERDNIRIRLFPFARKTVPAASIAKAETIRYRPLLDAGGWGIRFSALGTVYSMSGREAVKLTLADGRSILIGTKRPAELLKAVESIRSDAT